MTTPVLLPSPSKIGIEWLRSLSALSDFVDPVDIWIKHKASAQWVKPFAIVCTPILAQASVYAPHRYPVLQVDVYGRKVGQRLPWETCFALAELIAEQTYESTNFGELVVDNATRVKVGDISLSRAAQMVNRADAATLARASLDVRLNYLPVYEGEV